MFSIQNNMACVVKVEVRLELGLISYHGKVWGLVEGLIE